MSTVAAKSATGAIIGAGQKNMMGGSVWPTMAATVKLQDPHVIEIANFAVKKYNEQAGTALVFNNVGSGFWWNVEVSVVGKGYGYMVAIHTQDNKGTYDDVVLVSDTVVGGVHTYVLIWYNHNNN